MPADQQPDEARPLRLPTTTNRHKLAAWALEWRFVQEVHRLERDGRVKSRGDLENKLGMKPGTIALIRRGYAVASAYHVAQLGKVYNADMAYINYGDKPAGDTQARTIIRPGQGAVRIAAHTHTPYTYPYGTPAGWRIGPMPEPDNLASPDGAIWIPDHRTSKAVRAYYDAYRQAHPELPLPERLTVRARGKVPLFGPPTADAVAASTELRADLAAPLVPDFPEAGTRYTTYYAQLRLLPVFAYPAGHKKAGEPTDRLWRWWRNPQASLSTEQVAAVRTWLDEQKQAPSSTSDSE